MDRSGAKQVPPWGGRSNRSGAAALACFVAAIGSLAACQTPPGQFFIVHNKVPAEDCQIPADEGAPYRGEGRFDVRIASTMLDGGYRLFPLLANGLPAADDDATESNRIFLSGFTVDLRLLAGGPSAAALFSDLSISHLLHYDKRWSGSVGPSDLLAASVDVFPGELARWVFDTHVLDEGAMTVEIAVRARGRRAAGAIESDTFKYPLHLCDGCLVRSVAACPAAGPVLEGNKCNPAQDVPVDCCIEGDSLVCPATAATTPATPPPSSDDEPL